MFMQYFVEYCVYCMLQKIDKKILFKIIRVIVVKESIYVLE